MNFPSLDDGNVRCCLETGSYTGSFPQHPANAGVLWSFNTSTRDGNKTEELGWWWKEVLESLASGSISTLTSASSNPQQPNGKKEAAGPQKGILYHVGTTQWHTEGNNLKICVFLKNLSFVRSTCYN